MRRSRKHRLPDSLPESEALTRGKAAVEKLIAEASERPEWLTDDWLVETALQLEAGRGRLKKAQRARLVDALWFFRTLIRRSGGAPVAWRTWELAYVAVQLRARRPDVKVKSAIAAAMGNGGDVNLMNAVGRAYQKLQNRESPSEWLQFRYGCHPNRISEAAALLKPKKT